MHVNILWRCTCLLIATVLNIWKIYLRCQDSPCKMFCNAVSSEETVVFQGWKMDSSWGAQLPLVFVCQFHIYIWHFLYLHYIHCSIVPVNLLITLIGNFSLGFTGILCEENINNCDPDPCHHGECQDGIDSYTCICNPGYMGAICSEQIDECHSNPCLHQGRCIDLVNGYQCNCLLGTSGT